MQNPKLQVIRRASFTATPWKNGGGITHEALRVPPGGEPFRFRVSVAHIDASGPFSEFAEYQRKMVLLKGSGLDLRFGDGVQKSLRKEWVSCWKFDGALAAHCELLERSLRGLESHGAEVGQRAALRIERLRSESVAVNATRHENPADLSHRPQDHRANHGRENRDARALGPRGHVANAPGASADWSRRKPPVSTSVFLATLKFVSGE